MRGVSAGFSTLHDNRDCQVFINISARAMPEKGMWQIHPCNFCGAFSYDSMKLNLVSAGALEDTGRMRTISGRSWRS